ncbi:uncharacterized protein LOC113506432 [Trichoplusia ni]|uniref:Uncharacterized protein LOC113501437 n=1 Tax=Trichoplusia ni TaxID=7111 RepID=A0A7E5WX56_TRINI|nr:uncharacterized protein LOC113501437 [Trichoplusia ni]XP_026745089.1 uncharacterized protein LOC113506432 [Trichoplusia ni]
MSQSVRPKSCAKTYKTAELKVLKILSKIDSLKLSSSYISQLDIPKSSESNVLRRKSTVYVSLAAVLVGVMLLSARWVHKELLGNRNCILELPSFSKSVFRPPEDCSMCAGVDDVVRIANTTAEEFEEKYAYSTTPVIVTDATNGWRALEEFDFKFFADFYRDGKSMGKQINDCFYFAYKSGLNSLNEVFSMDETRANLSGKPWYVGWSTCYDEETRKLRTFYNRPYFLPKTAESDMVDWIFMGGPGQGAHMHVDSVKHMSWQAQVRGHKQWQLAPPPECLYQCRWITFTVAPSEILVVDTNRWYHKTNVLPGDISITIGAEYD